MKESKKFSGANVSIKTSTLDWTTSAPINWVSVSPGYIYISHQKGRAYWLFRNIPTRERPKIKAIDKTQTIHINSYSVWFKKQKDYEYVKDSILEFSR